MSIDDAIKLYLADILQNQDIDKLVLLLKKTKQQQLAELKAFLQERSVKLGAALLTVDTTKNNIQVQKMENDQFEATL